MNREYLTIKHEKITETFIKKSRFIAHAARVKNEKEVKEFIKKIKTQFWDANHNCYAYIIGELCDIQKSSDDGEPSGTAGVPILEAIKQKGLTDIAVVVTRYFGGIKLGVGGLIRAYGYATNLVLKSCEIVEIKHMVCTNIIISYALYGKINSHLLNRDFPLKKAHFSEKVLLQMYVAKKDFQKFEKWIGGLTNGEAVIEFGEYEYLEQNL